MNKSFKIFGLIFYLLFIQVYPIAHVHAHEHEGNIEFQLSVHPPEVVTDDHQHENENENTGDHTHKKSHYNGDSDYTTRLNKISIKIVSLPYVLLDNSIEVEPVTATVFESRIFSISQRQYRPDIPSRAPPYFS